MRKELRKCNFLGNAVSLQYLVSISATDYPTTVDAIKTICTCKNDLTLNGPAAIFFLDEIGIITIDDVNNVIATDFGLSFRGISEEEFIENMSRAVFLYLVENGLILHEAISFDPQTELCHIRKSGFPLSAAAFRNLLIEFEALIEAAAGVYQVCAAYETLFEETLRKQIPKLTLADLLEKQHRQEEQGRLAEEFVVAFEKIRFNGLPIAEGVRQISDIDVTAGYDVLSYEGEASTKYDRFIEVKSFHGVPQFFWSANECDVAKKLGDSYFLYLVDMEKYTLPNYRPIMISNPAQVFAQEDIWKIEVASWKITKI